jgi:hypothetical protein
LFGFDGRGPEISRFIHDRDALESGTFPERRPLPGKVIGVEYFWFEHSDFAWVIFEGLKVLQIVPEEVCSYWFLEKIARPEKGVGIYEAEDSPWLRSFAQRHLAGHRHFVLMFYDDIVEVVATGLIFGSGAFRISDHPELSYYK